MKTLSKLQQLSFIIRREFLAISTSYAVLLVLMGGIFVYGFALQLYVCTEYCNRCTCCRSRQFAQ